jgi:hypothetical protein
VVCAVRFERIRKKKKDKGVAPPELLDIFCIFCATKVSLLWSFGYILYLVCYKGVAPPELWIYFVSSVLQRCRSSGALDIFYILCATKVSLLRS